jgi:O-phospho-L-seryl-tRNASec:L-selenocysteinyl-tRNA synthase
MLLVDKNGGRGSRVELTRKNVATSLMCRMNQENFQLCKHLLSNPNYLLPAQSNAHTYQNNINSLLSNQQLPPHPWPNQQIQQFLLELSSLDSNNYKNNSGVGEREGRVYSSLVQQRHYYLAHGIGRSGDLCAEQPKAAGSNIIIKMTNFLTMHAIKLAGLASIQSVLLLPAATGLSITLVLLTLMQEHRKLHRNRDNNRPLYVIWPRIDQKTCLKCILTAGATPFIVENIVEGDSIRTDVAQFNENMIETCGGRENILCILSTASCFAPRCPDKLVELAEFAAKFSLPHVVNNAYGLQCSATCKLIEKAGKSGRIDCLISSMDKNFLVPVGGALIYTLSKQNSALLQQIAQIYPGRASISSLLDLLITLLSLGRSGWQELLQKRETMFQIFQAELQKFAEKIGEKVLSTGQNPISMAMTLNELQRQSSSGEEKKYNSDDKGTGDGKHESASSVSNVSGIGSMLYSRMISGVRVCNSSQQQKKITKISEGFEFANYGCHISNYPAGVYLTVAAAIGQSEEEIQQFFDRLAKVIKQFTKNQQNKAKISESATSEIVPLVHA